jgi:hypothetical protein
MADIVSGERVGDTLIRLSSLVTEVEVTRGFGLKEWRQWLRECGERLNEKIEIEGDKPQPEVPSGSELKSRISAFQQAKIIFQASTDAGGGCMLPDTCECFLCLLDRVIRRLENADDSAGAVSGRSERRASGSVRRDPREGDSN